MAGTHARSSGRRRAADSAEDDEYGQDAEQVPGRRRARDDRDRSAQDSDYGDVAARIAASPAPSSPPVGFPSALSTGSFRSEPAPAASRGATATQAPSRTAAPAASDRPRTPPSRPSAPSGPPVPPATPPARGPRDAGPRSRGTSPSAPPAARPAGPPPGPPGSSPPHRGLATPPSVPPPPARPAGGPPAGRPTPPPGPPAGRPTPPPGPPTAGPARPPSGPAPAGPRDRQAPASRPPGAPSGRPGAPPARPPAGAPVAGPRPPVRGGAPAARPATPPVAPDAPAPTRAEPAPAGRSQPTGTTAMPVPDTHDEPEDVTPDAPADEAGTTRAARPTRTAATRSTGGTSRTPSRSTSRAGTRTTRSSRTTTSRATTSRTTASRRATARNESPADDRRDSRDDAPAVPHGRIAAAIAVVLSVVAARVVRLPGGPGLVAFGRRVRARVVLYLDGPHPEALTATALRWRRLRRSAYAGLGAMIATPVLAMVVGWLFIPVPNADDAVESQLNTVSFSDGTVLARIAPGEQGNRQKVDLAQVPPPVRSAVLSAEDRTFYSNSGFDVTGFGRAVWKNLTGGTGGGSTITQQYVKNAMVGDDYSLVRKYKELIISLKISQQRSKDEILADYLNSIYFGRGAYGIQAASQAYFGRPVETLSPSEGALLAGVIQSPSRWDPAVRPEDAQRRWNYVMDGMVAQGWLPAPERAAATFPVTVPPRRVTGGVPDDDRGHIYSAVRDELRALGIDEDALLTEGLQIQTTIEPTAQREAVDAVRSKMRGQPENLRTSTVSIDPETGGILAYYGGDNGAGLDYARVEKQAGSTFKPFVLLAALQHDPPIGISAEFDGRAIPGRTVRNVDGADCANCSLKRAMTLSNNVVFTALGNRVGPQAVAAAARQAGITQPMENPDSGIALGNQETTAVDLASAYATFSNEGMYFRPHLVGRVTTASGEVLYDQSTLQGEQRIDPRVARNVTEAMRDVPEYDGVSLEGGRQAAGKTGTVQSHVESQNNDAWFAGYTPNASTVVWVGTDDNTPIRTSDGRPVYGHGLPSEIWKTFMDDALEDAPKQTFGTFTPVAGSDPGDTARDESPSPSTSASAASSSAPTSTTTAPAVPTEPAEEVPAAGEAEVPAEDPGAAGEGGAAPAEGDPPAN
ncbi:transglycosylase domain-containing protein [Actinomycetospora sp. CA-101289]|uniref:transglycosylase domain-containing protein n=1 Tax=Actinomycetospora sp. CA-101289 TaxID=3239893 RepID=UPI003D98C893